jgi:hypothetical protein
LTARNLLFDVKAVAKADGRTGGREKRGDLGKAETLKAEILK